MDFNDYENLGRRRLTMVFPTIDWSFTEDPNCSYDAYAQHNNKFVIAEIKNRNLNSFKYSTCFLELNKAISNLTYNDVDTVLYVVHYQDNITATWNLTNMNLFENYEVSSTKMNEKTAENTGKIKKEVYELKLSDADLRQTATGKKIIKQ
ncbi:hypothetical protein [Sphingobacterium mizutaii]|uniref:hypothetical protein n=1 Tax=Sphingobacterium mizutaii TaxID=1010 RepID=UPI001625CE6E|nr:hypothetical protein [Sphingobacterium mizutaii]